MPAAPTTASCCGRADPGTVAANGGGTHPQSRGNPVNSAVAKTMTAKVTHLIATLMRGGAEKQLWCLSTALERRGWPQSVIAFSPGGVWEPHSRGGHSRLLPRAPLVQALAAVAASPPAGPGETASPHVLVAGHRGLCALGLRARRTAAGRRRPRRLDRRFQLVPAGAAFPPAPRRLGARRRRGEQFAVQPAGPLRPRPPSSPRRGGPQYRGCPGQGPARRAGDGAADRRHRVADSPQGLRRVVAGGGLVGRRGESVRLWIAGGGAERSRLEALAAALHVAERVRFLGEVADARTCGQRPRLCPPGAARGSATPFWRPWPRAFRWSPRRPAPR